MSCVGRWGFRVYTRESKLRFHFGICALENVTQNEWEVFLAVPGSQIPRSKGPVPDYVVSGLGYAGLGRVSTGLGKFRV